MIATSPDPPTSMQRRRLEEHLTALGLNRQAPPDAATWPALLARLEADTLDEQLLQRERYLEAVVEMQALLLTASDEQLGAFNAALAPLGVAAGASRVYLFENHRDAQGRLLLSQRAEWCAPGISPEIDNPDLQNLPYDEFVPRWYDMLSQRRAVEGVVRDFPEGERNILEMQGVLAVLVLPMFVEGEFIGFIGFDNCRDEQPWSALEANLLSAAASNIALIMEQRRAQRRLRVALHDGELARDRALEASRAKSVFLAKISHELRTPLNAIIGYSEILMEASDELDEEQRQADLARILASGRHLLSVINDLLDVSRAEAQKLTLSPDTFALEELVQEVMAVMPNLVRRHNNRFHCVLPTAPGMLYSDRTRLHQVLLNLLSNACKYTRGGDVTLTLEADDEAITFHIDDTGIGIEPDQLEHIFDAFAQADNSSTRAYEGTGLGLTICKHLCELLGAELRVASTLGRGSRFSLTLPRRLSV